MRSWLAAEYAYINSLLIGILMKKPEKWKEIRYSGEVKSDTALFLQGFHAWGFNLPEKLVYGFAIAAIGAIVGFTYIILRFLFRTDKK